MIHKLQVRGNEIEAVLTPKGFVENVWINSKLASRYSAEDNYYFMSCRQVFIGDELVVKFDADMRKETVSYLGRSGFQTAKEIKLWKALKDSHKKYFCEPLAYGKVEGKFWYCVQEKLAFNIEDVKNSQYKAIQKIVKHYDLADVSAFHPHYVRNVGVCPETGKFKIYDYGI